VVIPGRRWRRDSNGCGKVRGRVAGGPELSTSGQLPQPGGWKASPAGQRQGVAYGPVQACVRVCVAACGPTCAGLRAASQSRLRTCVQVCASRVRICVRLCAGQILRPPPPFASFGLALSRMVNPEERNETWEVLERRPKIFSLHIRGTRTGSHSAVRVEPTTTRWVGSRWIPLMDRAYAGQLASRAAGQAR